MTDHARAAAVLIQESTASSQSAVYIALHASHNEIRVNITKVNSSNILLLKVEEYILAIFILNPYL